jgi:peptidoglycan DL-endopeptidase CwlO
MALDGAAATGTVIGTAPTGTALVATGEIGTADGVGGTATDGGIPGIMWCSLAILAFPGGGVGAGVRGLAGDGAGATRMDITATVTRTTAAMVTAMETVASTSLSTETVASPSLSTDTVASISLSTDTAASTSLSTEIAASPESRNCNVGCNALAITTDPLTESWGHKRGAQSGRTNRSTATWVNLDPSSQAGLA